MDRHEFSEEEAEEILAEERRRRDAAHDRWCNENEGRFTDADGVQTMANYDSFWR